MCMCAGVPPDAGCIYQHWACWQRSVNMSGILSRPLQLPSCCGNHSTFWRSWVRTVPNTDLAKYKTCTWKVNHTTDPVSAALLSDAWRADMPCDSSLGVFVLEPQGWPHLIPLTGTTHRLRAASSLVKADSRLVISYPGFSITVNASSSISLTLREQRFKTALCFWFNQLWIMSMCPQKNLNI